MLDDFEPYGGAAMKAPLDPRRTAQLTSKTLWKAHVSANGGSIDWDPPSVTDVQGMLPFKNYDVCDFIGRGGMGAVYKARQKSLDRWVAIKILPLEVSQDQDFRDRFTREARALARLSHPRVVTIHEFGITLTDQLYFVMEYVDGVDLHSRIRQDSLTREEILSIVQDLADGLEFIHSHGIIHRDVKPANILLDRFGRPKIADFGLARECVDLPIDESNLCGSTVLGTPTYMAPEQSTKLRVDHRVDIFALGVILDECLSMSTDLNTEDPLFSIVRTACAEDPNHRYATAREMMLALLQRANSVASCDDDPRQNPKRVIAVLLVVAVALVVIGSTISWRSRVVSNVPPRPALSISKNIEKVREVSSLPLPAWFPQSVFQNAKPGTFIATADGVTIHWPRDLDPLVLRFGQEVENQSISVTYKAADFKKSFTIGLLVRSTGSPYSAYSATWHPSYWCSIRNISDGRPIQLFKIQMDNASDRLNFHTAQFRVEQQLLSFYLDGELKAKDRDPRIPSGFVGLKVAGDIVLKDVIWTN